ncbi:unnamed protein product [Closterium sp. NIES-64]|nr:unnamed protein product [Closterium sp. NIES-64]
MNVTHDVQSPTDHQRLLMAFENAQAGAHHGRGAAPGDGLQGGRFERASQHQGASAHEAGGVDFNSTTADEKRSRGGAASTPWNVATPVVLWSVHIPFAHFPALFQHAAASFASVCHALTDSLLVLPAGSFDQYNAKAVMLTKLVVWAPAAEKRSRGEEERGRRGAEEKRNGGEEERRRRGTEEKRSGGGEEKRSIGAEKRRTFEHMEAGDEQWRGEEQRRGAEEGRRVAEETSSVAEEHQSRGAEEKRSTFEHLDWKVLSTSPKAQLERLKSQGRSGERQGSSSECHGRPNTLQRSFTAGSTVQATPPACTLKVAVSPPPASTLHTSPPPFPWCYSGGPSLATNQDSRQQPGARQLIGARQHQDLLGTALRINPALCSKPALQLGAEATRNGQQKGATGSRKVQRAAERCNGQHLRVGALEQGRGESTVSLTSSSFLFPFPPSSTLPGPRWNPAVEVRRHGVKGGGGWEAWEQAGSSLSKGQHPLGLWLVGRGVVGGICAARHSVLKACLSGARGKWITMEGKDDSVGGKRRKGGGGVEEWGM